MLIKRALSVVVVALVCVGCDQTTKLAARSLLPPSEVKSLFGDTVRLQLTTNQGAFLSLGHSLSEEWRYWLLSFGVGCLLLAMLGYALLSKSLRPLQALALAMVLGGGVSNLWDRLKHGGHVVDFINLGVGSVRTGIFNVADMAICAGVLLLWYSSRTVRTA